MRVKKDDFKSQKYPDQALPALILRVRSLFSVHYKGEQQMIDPLVVKWHDHHEFGEQLLHDGREFLSIPYRI